MWKYKNNFIKTGKAWTDDLGVQHPANWNIWSEEEKKSKGLVWVDIQPQPDSRFYWFSQNADGTFVVTPKYLEDQPRTTHDGVPIIDPVTMKQMVTPGLKTQWTAQIKTTQGSLLAQTDWAYIRKADTGIDVPADIQKYRDLVRLTAAVIEDQISQCTTLDEFIALFDTPVDSDGNPTGNPPMYNWPEMI